MPSKRYKAEEIIHKLREADVLLGQGQNVSQVCKQLGVSEQTYYRWRKTYGGMKVGQAKRLTRGMRNMEGKKCERWLRRGVDIVKRPLDFWASGGCHSGNSIISAIKV